jgi:hypothetical protein
VSRAGESHHPRALRTVREPLSSYGSRHGTTPHAHLPVRKQPWITT